MKYLVQALDEMFGKGVRMSHKSLKRFDYFDSDIDSTKH